MPKFMKDRAIQLLDGGIESYLLGLYGMGVPFQKNRRKIETRYAPIMGMFGACVELLVKACLVQAKGISAMYKDGDINTGIYKFGVECINELKNDVNNDASSISFLWKDESSKQKNKELVIHHLNKFRLLQELRANGLHAGKGCSRDIVVSIANDIYDFIQLISNGKKLKAYLKGVPSPEPVIRDREVIIEDLQRRLNTKSTINEKVDILRGMYIVLPYVPEIRPDWIDCFDKVSITPPTNEDVNYLVKTLQEAHSIYLLKGRGGKEGFPVKIEPNNPDALPIAIQNIKRTLNSIPDIFNNDVLTANTWLEKKRLHYPIDDFLVDLYALGVSKANILKEGNKLTAQQVWPFVVSAYSTQGTPRPCWDFIMECDELEKLISYLRRAKSMGNGYFKRRVDTLIKCIDSYKKGTPINFHKTQDHIFEEIKQYSEHIAPNNVNPITPQLLKGDPLSEHVVLILTEYISQNLSAGDAVEQILASNLLNTKDKRVVVAIMRACSCYKERKGTIAVLRSEKMKTYHSEARKQMFFVDFLHSGICII